MIKDNITETDPFQRYQECLSYFREAEGIRREFNRVLAWARNHYDEKNRPKMDHIRSINPAIVPSVNKIAMFKGSPGETHIGIAIENHVCTLEAYENLDTRRHYISAFLLNFEDFAHQIIILDQIQTLTTIAAKKLEGEGYVIMSPDYQFVSVQREMPNDPLSPEIVSCYEIPGLTLQAKPLQI